MNLRWRSASPHPPSDSSPPATVWPLSRQTPGPPCPYPLERPPPDAIIKDAVGSSAWSSPRIPKKEIEFDERDTLQFEYKIKNKFVKQWIAEILNCVESSIFVFRLLQESTLFLFVISNETRCIASLVEAAYLAGCGRQLLVVMTPPDPPHSGATIQGEPITQK